MFIQDREVALVDVNGTSDRKKIRRGAMLAGLLHQRHGRIPVLLPIHERFTGDTQQGEVYSVLRIFHRWLYRRATDSLVPM